MGTFYPTTNYIHKHIMGCCNNFSRVTIISIFSVINGLVILFSICLVLWNIIATFAPFAESWTNDFATSIGIPTSTINTFLVLSTLLASLFSGLAAFGMEAANFRQYWEMDMFKICCCNLLKTKMIIYIIVTGLLGIGLIVLTSIVQTGLVDLNVESLLANYKIGGCEEVVTALVKPLQQSNKCCGLTFSTTSSDTSCGNWENGITDECDCASSDISDSNVCISAADAISTYGCSSTTSNPIYFNGCMNSLIDNYFTGFGIIYIFGYVLSAFLLVCNILAIYIFIKGEKGDSKVDKTKRQVNI